jgi:alkane 1-monooxygenase
MTAKRYSYLAVLIVPALLPLSAWLGQSTGYADALAWFPLIFLFVLLPIADYLVGRDAANPADDAAAEVLEKQVWYRALTLACVPIFLALLAWSGWWYAHADLGTAGKLGWLISQGVIGGVLAINVAHELIHKAGRLEPFAGGILLASVGYATFKIEHLRGHHVHVSTPKDASSARFGQNVYGFVAQSIPRNIANAWRLEAERLARRGLPWWHWRNELLWWSLASLALLGAFAAWLGATGAVYFLAQCAGAFISLEIINYIEHYGLERRELAPGRYERTTHLHSWNSNYLLTNLLLFQLQRHSDHHENARRRYQALRHYDASPQLPGGYAAMFALALLPPLWFRVIDPRVPKACGLT